MYFNTCRLRLRMSSMKGEWAAEEDEATEEAEEGAGRVKGDESAMRVRADGRRRRREEDELEDEEETEEAANDGRCGRGR